MGFWNILKIFDTDSNSSVSLNPGATPRVTVSRGIGEGCSISPNLFILAIQLLTFLINNSEDVEGFTIFDKEFKISQFADDTSIFLKDRSTLATSFNTISIFSKASGLSLNKKKSEPLLP